MNSKGQAVNLSGAPMLIVIIMFTILLASAAALALNAIRDSTGNTGTETLTEMQKNLAAATATYFANYDSYAQPASTCTVSTVYNTTNNILVQGAANRTISGAGNCYVNVSSTWGNVNVTSANVYTTYAYGYNVSYFGLEGMMNFGEQLPTVGLVVGVAIVVTVVIGAFWAFLQGQTGNF